MTKISGKTIYILGAGASFHTGAPLLKDFIIRARMLTETGYSLKYKDSFLRVFQWIDRMRGASYYVDFDLDNLEHVFSLIELDRQLGKEGAKQLKMDLQYLILETLDTCQLIYRKGGLLPDDIYKKFVEQLHSLNEERVKIVGTNPNQLDRDIVVTFNYDVMLDYAFRMDGKEPNYCAFEEKDEIRFPYRLLKLHGSTNWAKCDSCGNEGQIIPANPIAEGRHYGPLTEEGVQAYFKMVTDVLVNTKCCMCGKTDVLTPYIIPPIWTKRVEDTPLVQVWKKFVSELGDAYQIVIIGYSLPPTDTFFQYLLTLGLAENSKLYRVIIVDIDKSPNFEDRYKQVFSRALNARGRLEFLTGITFEMFVSFFMRDIGKNMNWRNRSKHDRYLKG